MDKIILKKGEFKRETDTFPTFNYIELNMSDVKYADINKDNVIITLNDNTKIIIKIDDFLASIYGNKFSKEENFIRKWSKDCLLNRSVSYSGEDLLLKAIFHFPYIDPTKNNITIDVGSYLYSFRVGSGLGSERKPKNNRKKEDYQKVYARSKEKQEKKKWQEDVERQIEWQKREKKQKEELNKFLEKRRKKEKEEERERKRNIQPSLDKLYNISNWTYLYKFRLINVVTKEVYTVKGTVFELISFLTENQFKEIFTAYNKIYHGVEGYLTLVDYEVINK